VVRGAIHNFLFIHQIKLHCLRVRIKQFLIINISYIISLTTYPGVEIGEYFQIQTVFLYVAAIAGADIGLFYVAEN